MRSPRRTADHCAPIGGWLPTGCDAAIRRAYGIAGDAARLVGSISALDAAPAVHSWRGRRALLDILWVGFHNHAMERLFGAAAAMVTWLGWLAICPALGFPPLGTVGMVNRALYREIPEAGHNPNFWLGWLILIAALAAAIALFLMFERLRIVRASIRTGVIFGLALWLLVGIIVMPLIGLLDPTTQPPDAMHGTLMMYTLGPLASVAALIAWALFGAILGATGSTRSAAEMVSAR